jgi:hypothetical protein
MGVLTRELKAFKSRLVVAAEVMTHLLLVGIPRVAM